MNNKKISAVFNLRGYVETMHPLTKHRPVGALPFSGRYRIVDFLLSSISHSNIESVAMFISGSGRSIYDHVRSGLEWDLNSPIRGGLFTFSQQNWKTQFYKSVKQEKDYFEDLRVFLHKSKDDYVVLMSGEVIHTLNVDDLAEKHEVMGGDVTLVYSIQDTHQAGFIVDGDRIVEIDNSNGYKAMSMDIFYMSIETLNDILDKAVRDNYYEDIYQVIVNYLKDYELRAYEYRGYARKITSAQEFFDANMAMLVDKNYDKLFNSEVPVITRARSGPPAYYGKTAKVINSQIATGARICGHVENSLIFRKVSMEEDSIIKNSILMTGAKIGHNVKLEYVLLDKDVTIGDNVSLQGTPDKVLVIEKGQVVKEGDYE